MTTTVKVEDAAEMLPDLLARVERGEEVVLERDGVPVVRMTGCETTGTKPSTRQLGRWEGRVTLPPGFFDPMTEDELAEWYDAPLTTSSE